MPEDIFVKTDGGVWSPVCTLPRNEKKAYADFSAQGVPAYLPLKKHINIQPILSKGKNYSYKRVLHVPMFPGYLFACLTPAIRSEAKRNRFIFRTLPVNPREEETLLQELRIIRELELYSATEELDVFNGLQAGKKVTFTGGPFAGWQGVVAALESRDTVSINISCIQASIRIKYPAQWCRLCEE